jgi:hypothetical protein
VAEHDSDSEEREDREPDEQHVPFDEDAAWAAIVAGYGEEPPDPPGTKPFRSVEDLALLETQPGEEGPSRSGGSGVSGAPEPPDGAVGADRADGTDRAGGTGAGAAEAAGRTGAGDREDTADPAGAPSAESAGRTPAGPLGGSVSFAPGVGPRDYSLPEPAARKDKGAGGGADDDEGHFVPPEPPPLPAADTTAKFAWLGVLGGPVLLLLAVLLGWEMTWWLTTLAIGGFLGGFATLVTRMRADDEEDDDPGRGAVV